MEGKGRTSGQDSIDLVPGCRVRSVWRVCQASLVTLCLCRGCGCWAFACRCNIDPRRANLISFAVIQCRKTMSTTTSSKVSAILHSSRNTAMPIATRALNFSIGLQHFLSPSTPLVLHLVLGCCCQGRVMRHRAVAGKSGF